MDNSLSRRLQSVVGNRENGRYQMHPISVPDLNDVAIGIAVRKREPISAGRQNQARHFDWFTECEFGCLIPFIGHDCARHRSHKQQSQAESEYERLVPVHVVAPFRFCAN